MRITQNLSLILLKFCCNLFLDTEIDWIAYMQEVEGFLTGERNYRLIRGDTGPLVYPAGFLYIFTFLRRVTENGKNILKGFHFFYKLFIFVYFKSIILGQYIFMVIYIINLITIFVLYFLAGDIIPFWSYIPLIFSKRIHSIFMLRLFNDCIAVLFSYVALYLFVNYKVVN